MAASDIATAIKTKLAEAYAGEKGLRVAIVPGQILVTDWAWFGCPVVFVRLDSLFPSSQFPNPASVSTPCGNPIVARFHAGVTRCIHGMTERGDTVVPPTAEEQTEDSLTLMADAELIRRVLCEVVADRDLFDPKGVSLGAWQPLGPLGNTAGGYWPLTSRLLVR